MENITFIVGWVVRVSVAEQSERNPTPPTIVLDSVSTNPEVGYGNIIRVSLVSTDFQRR
jgi:hypothetical protein